MRKWLVLVGVAAVLWFVLPAAPVAAAGHAIQMKQYAFSPSSMSIAAGDSVTWTNYDTAQHDVMITSGPLSFHGPLIGKGQSWTYTFGTAGTYSYICSIHPDMKAQLVVKAKPAPVQQPAPQPTKPAAPATTSRPAASATPTAAAVVPSASPSAPMSMPGTADTSSSSDLNPLLVVAAISVAVVVFCLLLMTSRPVPAVVARPGAGSPEAAVVDPPEPAAPKPVPAAKGPAHRNSDLEDTAVLPEAVDSK